MTGRLATEFMETSSLKELVTMVEREISHYTSKKEEYSERLGNFLRESEEKHGDEDWFKRLSLGEKLPKGKPKRKEKGGRKKRGKKGGEPGEWVPFHSVHLSSSVQGEAELMFEAIEVITARIGALEEAKESIEELRSVGIGEEAVYIVLLREGVPEKIVIKPTGAEAAQKFIFSKGFTVVQLLQPRPA
ncbi:hypothetical protein AC482_05425 [miscellaneous Crenarchaeota group-15 archaeon DG-45]|uniref:Uncharacterized protein n=1 Tax=miscellaneous Crenarchaeota group-15 archaeon DG-45 TaxID=1685127 RepID=A0A0M0BMR0_9ARCH|nr:MAG: hypothetical protein AC482_05425 [miscellaneous Crenarchaeota group-15 archaeon DG-45]